MKAVQRVDQPVVTYRIVLARRRIREVVPSPSQVDAVVGGRLDVVVGDGQAGDEEGGYARVSAKTRQRADVVHHVIDDRVVGADALHAGRILLVSPPVADVDVLRVANGDATSRDVGDVVPGDVGVDDIVDHRDAFVSAVLDHVAGEVNRVGAGHVDHAGQRVRDLVLAVVPVAVTVRDIHGRALHGRLPVRSREGVEAVVRVLEGDPLEREVLDPVRGRRSPDVDQPLYDGRLDVGRRHVLARPRVVVERPGRLVEEEL